MINCDKYLGIENKITILNFIRKLRRKYYMTKMIKISIDVVSYQG